MNHSKMIAAKRIAVAVAAVFATMSAPAMAADAKSLLDLMLKKGVITQAEYDDYLKSDAYENQQFKDKRIDDDVSKSVKFVQKREKDGAVKEGGFGLRSANGEHELNLTGRVHFDGRYISSDFKDLATHDRDLLSSADNFEVRRARIGFNGKLFNDIGYEFVTNAVGSNANLIDTAWINYGYNQAAQVRVGRFKQPFNLEELTSSNNIDFMERSYVNQLAPAKKNGVMLHGVPAAGYTYGISLYQEDFSQASSNGGFNAAARATANFAQLTGVSDAVLHFGVGATNGTVDVTPTTSGNGGTSTTVVLAGFRSEDRGLANILRIRQKGVAVSNAGYSAPSNSTTELTKRNLGLEAALATGASKLQGEMVEQTVASQNYTVLGAKNNDEMSGKIKVYYLEALYNLTGEKWSENYSNGTFGALKIKNNFNSSGSGLGAWQVGFRFSSFDASDLWNKNASATSLDGRVGSAKGSTATVGLTWFINPNARIMFNYARTKVDTPFTPVDLDASITSKYSTENVYSIRTQVNF